MDKLFGYPVVKYKINPNNYNKEEIINTILHNYEIDKERNNWDPNSNLHHSIDDELNNNFKTPNYSILEKIYLDMSKQYVKSLSINNEIKIKIINYSVVEKNNHMDPHVHAHADFVGSHYISFDSQNHQPTLFINPSDSIFTYARVIKPELHKKFLNQNSSLNSWMLPAFTYPAVEDDVLIWPSLLKHGIHKQTNKSTKKRISIAWNIYINESIYRKYF